MRHALPAAAASAASSVSGLDRAATNRTRRQSTAQASTKITRCARTVAHSCSRGGAGRRAEHRLLPISSWRLLECCSRAGGCRSQVTRAGLRVWQGRHGASVWISLLASRRSTAQDRGLLPTDALTAFYALARSQSRPDQARVREHEAAAATDDMDTPKSLGNVRRWARPLAAALAG